MTRWDRGPISDYFLVWIDLFSVELIVEMGVRRFMGVPLVSCGSRGRLLVALGHVFLGSEMYEFLFIVWTCLFASWYVF